MLTMTSALSQVMVTASPAVSPSVVARILMIQKPSVTSGTLVAPNSERLCFVGRLFISPLYQRAPKPGRRQGSVNGEFEIDSEKIDGFLGSSITRGIRLCIRVPN